jgi:hypothetical protein
MFLRTKKKKKPTLIVLTKDEAKKWGQEVLKQLGVVADLKKDTFIILAGQSYLEPIEYGLTNIEKPFVINGKKLRQGERVKFLASKLK